MNRRNGKMMWRGALLGLTVSFAAFWVDASVYAEECVNNSVTFASDTIVSSGKCGEKLTWSLGDNGVLTISGTGEMWDMVLDGGEGDGVTNHTCPWTKNKDSIKKVVFAENVTSVGNWAFSYCENLESVILNDKIVTLGDGCFTECPALKDIKMTESIESIGYGAFSNCTSLSQMVIPVSVTSLKNDIWWGCTSLKSVTVEALIDPIYLTGSGMFKGCDLLEEFRVPEDNTVVKSMDGVLFTKDGTELLQYPNGKKDKQYDIPEGVTFIGGALDGCIYLEKISIPSSLKEICISYMPALKELVIPETVESLGGQIGPDCDSLVKIVNQSNSTAALVSHYGGVWVDQQGEVVETLAGKSTIVKCDVLKDIETAKNVDTLDLQVGESQTLLYTPFYVIDTIVGKPEDIVFTTSDSNIVSVDEKGVITAHKLGTATITLSPRFMTSDWMGNTATYTVEVKDAADIKQITKDNVFFEVMENGNAKLVNGQFCVADYTIPAQLSVGGRNIVVTTISGDAFYMNEKLQRLVMPDTLTVIEDGYSEDWVSYSTFWLCENLKEVVFSKELKYIGWYAFYGCSALKNVQLPAKLEVIAEGAFLSCSAITEIKIPESVDKIGQCAFTKTSIKAFHLPASVEGCHMLALADIATLETITVEEGHPNYVAKDNVMYTADFKSLVRYPGGKKDEVFVMDERTVDIFGSLCVPFAGNSYLKKVVFSSGYKADAKALIPALLQGTVIEELAVAEGNQSFSVKDGVLYSKDGKTLYLYPPGKKDKIFFIPSGVERLGNDSCHPMESTIYLEEVYVPASVTEFDAMLWQSSSLKKVIFASESQIENIGEACFQGCTGLKTICFPASFRTFAEMDSYGNEFISCDNMEVLYVAQGAPVYTGGTYGTQTLSLHNSEMKVYGWGSDNTLSRMAETFGKNYVDVSSGFDKVLGVTFKDVYMHLERGDSRMLNTVVYPENIIVKTIFYESSNPSIATVSADGRVTAVADGVCYITATAKDGSGEYARCQICVGDESQVRPGSTSDLNNMDNSYVGWREENGISYWYENGVKQGYDPDNTAYRGKEIYDPVSDAWYWLDNVQNGAVAKSKDVYQESDAGQWADRADGTGKWVRYDESGHMVKGWQVTDAGTYYFDTVYGTMAKGYATIDKKEYYFDEGTGVLQYEIGEVPEFGWKTIDGMDYWYEGYTRQGFKVDDTYRGKEIYDQASDAWYWLDNVSGGAKAISKDVYQDSLADDVGNIGKWVRYDAEGHMIKGWSTNEYGTYYFDKTYGTMLKGTQVIDGEEYYFDEATGIRQ